MWPRPLRERIGCHGSFRSPYRTSAQETSCAAMGVPSRMPIPACLVCRYQRANARDCTMLQYHGFLVSGEVTAGVEGGQSNREALEGWRQVDTAVGGNIAGQDGRDQYCGNRRMHQTMAREASGMYQVGLLGVASDEGVMVRSGAIKAAGGGGQPADIDQAWNEL